MRSKCLELVFERGVARLELVELGLGLGMTFDEDVLDPSALTNQPNSSGGSPSILLDDDEETAPINPASALFD